MVLQESLSQIVDEAFAAYATNLLALQPLDALPCFLPIGKKLFDTIVSEEDRQLVFESSENLQGNFCWPIERLTGNEVWSPKETICRNRNIDQNGIYYIKIRAAI